MLLPDLSAPPRNGSFHTVVIDGRGGAGKSTVSELLLAAHPDLVLVHGDDWFEPTPSDEVWGAYDWDRFDRQLVQPLKAGPTFVHQVWDWSAGGLGPATEVTVARVFVLELWLGFRVELDWDLRVWVETPRELCLQRGLERDAGMDPHAWTVWQQMEDEHIDWVRPLETADVVLDGTRPFEEQLRS